MLDTVILNIPKGSYWILKPEYFNPPAIKLDYRSSFYTKFVNNPTATDKKEGIYKPRLTINKRGQEIPLKIEFSVPKLLFRNNLQEVSEEHFDEIVEILSKKLWEMGVGVSKENLRNAEVTSFHPSKNIPINGGYSAMGAIRELGKVNLTEKLDLSKTNFRNTGHGLQFYAKSHSLVFYDKIQDLQKTESRAIDKDQKIQQLSLFDYLEKKKRPEVLRMEIRLSEKQKMNSIMQKLGYPKKPTFQEVVRKEVCQKVLIYYFDTYLMPNLFIFDLEGNPQNYLKKILHQHPKMKPAKAIFYVGLQQLSKDKGVRELRKLIQTRVHKRTWQRISQEISKLNTMTSANHTHGFIKDIKDSLIKFEPFRFIG